MFKLWLKDVWSTDVLEVGRVAKFLMKDNKVFIFISSVSEVKPTFAYMYSLFEFYFVRMII